MMSVEVKVPLLSESVSEATLLKWHKKEGDYVDRDENLIDIETDKVVLEVPAPAAGVLAKIIKGDGATVTSGEVIASIDTEPAKDTAVRGAQPSSQRETGTGQAARKQMSWPEPQSQRKPSPPPPAGAPAHMMPAARGAAAAAGLGAAEVGSIKGSGRGGRITKEDIVAHVEHKSPPAPPPVESGPPAVEPPPPPSDKQPTPAPAPSAKPISPPAPPAQPAGDRLERRESMSRLRARIA
ncbi:MAG TPA: biotin/lipoyl-containing protein, partial [Nitrosospira sp.]|nr:biotin/lipoyl-containing protein [Nitrosospira sp.]